MVVGVLESQKGYTRHTLGSFQRGRDNVTDYSCQTIISSKMIEMRIPSAGGGCSRERKFRLPYSASDMLLRVYRVTYLTGAGDAF